MIAGGVRVLNVGLPAVVQGVPAQDVVQLDWRPPAFGDVAAARLGVVLDDDVTRAANRRALAAVHAVRPQLVAVRPARDVVPGLGEGRTLLHAGPPLEVERMCGPVRGALIGAVLLEGWAGTPTDALALIEAGGVTLDACHHHGAVGPMAGVLAPSMPVLVVQDGARRAYASLNEGLGRVLRFGAFDAEVVDRLRWMRDVLGPVLDGALRAGGSVDVTSLVAQSLTMGDEGHNRCTAATLLLARRLAPCVAEQDRGVEVLRFLAENDHFALNLSMAAAKLSMDAAVGVEHSTLVTAMARNGVEFGLRVAGTGERWFTAPVDAADGLFFPGYGIADANPDLGDSAITETLGIGGFAMAAAPAITLFVGGTPDDALDTTRSMARITLGPHPAFRLPALNFAGAPSGIDVLKVLDTGVLPVINTGIAHREAGVGQIGAGIVEAPAGVFLQAVRALHEVRVR
ncbi:DUF1116 domain-containing protein [Cellulomonas wangsupingiae]|uniref:DUF1116 domain-containing protein n=1 Tax=Cellulomonas wangsupingiae TaxID=2968085 RepID=A0ABY5K8B9_9CELL|nr:DUF1116 domain-containing protein [Cellulomonas wangsupingiae]MCC2335341.1 DUF1116 domain-containing protein [Cellulomonas wangsupingiae]MCM0639038.1 DUF1116 domain-containing protein [Cellulomonas wangsupingiae]UUI66524.1 DUF1116 domain-containing protein [Cellulomonas wangsupingiae]